MNSLTLVRTKTSGKRFELPAALIEAMRKALAIGSSRSVVCGMANLSEKKFDKWITLGQRLWDKWHDGERDFTLWEQGVMEFSNIVLKAELEWLIKAQGAVDRGLTDKNHVAQGRFAIEILERRDAREWGKRSVIQVENKQAALLGTGQAERLTVDDLDTMRKEVNESRSEEIKKRMEQ